MNLKIFKNTKSSGFPPSREWHLSTTLEMTERERGQTHRSAPIKGWFFRRADKSTLRGGDKFWEWRMDFLRLWQEGNHGGGCPCGWDVVYLRWDVACLSCGKRLYSEDVWNGLCGMRLLRFARNDSEMRANSRSPLRGEWTDWMEIVPRLRLAMTGGSFLGGRFQLNAPTRGKEGEPAWGGQAAGSPLH